MSIDPQFEDLRAHLDGVIGNPPRLAAPHEVYDARQRLDRWSVHKGQMSAMAFRAEWEIDVDEVPLPNYPEKS